MNVSETLLNEVKTRCYITDPNEFTTNRLNRIITNSIPKIRRMIGVDDSFDFENADNSEELELLLNYCWYAWNDATHEFKDNYLDDINSLHHKHMVEQNDTEEENI